MTPSMVINRDQPWCPRYAMEEMSGPLKQLTCEQRGIIQDFRDYAWVNFGLPVDERALEQLAIRFGLSRYKFRKHWTMLKKFFTCSVDKLVYQQDEEHREAAREKLDKARESGKLGADIKKLRSVQSINQPKISTDFSTRVPPGTLQQEQQQQELELESSKAAAAEESTGIGAMSEAIESAAAESKELARKPPERVLATEYPEAKKLIASCGRFSDVTTDFVEKLASLAREVEPGLDDGTLCDAIRATFKREKQLSAGLWLVTVPAWLRNRSKAATA